jgi:hypothetical protein
VCGEVDGGNELWLETVPYLKWGLSRGAMGMDIVGELGKGEEVNPIVLLEVAKDTETVTRGLRVLREQLFLRLLLTTCRASEYTLDLESCLGTLRQS